MSFFTDYADWTLRSHRAKPLAFAAMVPLLGAVAWLFGPDPVDHARRDLWSDGDQRLLLLVDARGGDSPAVRWQLRHASGDGEGRALHTSSWEPSPSDRAAPFAERARGTSLPTGHLVAAVGSWLCVAPPGARAQCVRDAQQPVTADAGLATAWEAARTWARGEPPP